MCRYFSRNFCLDVDAVPQVYSKDSSGRSVPKQLLPDAYKSGTCLIDGFLDKTPEFATKQRTVNPAGRCTGSGGKTQTPTVRTSQYRAVTKLLADGEHCDNRVGRVVQACKKSPTGARIGGKEAWHWDKISAEHPAKAEWFACPIPGVEEVGWSGGCIDGRTNPVSRAEPAIPLVGALHVHPTSPPCTRSCSTLVS